MQRAFVKSLDFRLSKVSFLLWLDKGMKLTQIIHNMFSVSPPRIFSFPLHHSFQEAVVLSKQNQIVKPDSFPPGLTSFIIQKPIAIIRTRFLWSELNLICLIIFRKTALFYFYYVNYYGCSDFCCHYVVTEQAISPSLSLSGIHLSS